MKSDAALAQRTELAGQYLQTQTGHRSWATVLADEQLYQCHRCGQKFQPTERDVAHHYAGACLTEPVK